MGEVKVHNPFGRLTMAQGEDKLQLWSDDYQRLFDGNIYHYTSAAALGGILSSRAFYCTDYRQLNDTTELSTGFEVLEAVIAVRAEAAGISSGNIDDMLDHLALLRRAPMHISMFVASFSLHGNDLAQWRAYAPHHGVSIGFNLKALERIAAEQHFVYGPVRYIGAPLFHEFLNTQLASMKEGLVETAANEALLRKQAADQPSEHVDLSIHFQRSGNLERWIGEVAGLLKNPDFRSEAEWRCVFVHRLNTIQPQKLMQFRSSGPKMIRFVELDLSQIGLNELIHKVIIGPGPGGKETFRIVADLLKQTGLNAEVTLLPHAVR